MDAPVRIENRAQLIYLLTEAAELEHGIMCCYLFAAFSMKVDVKEGVSEEQLGLMRRWRGTIMQIAAEEMLHMSLACNLLTAVGGAPHLRRPNLPTSPKAYPPSLKLALVPFCRETLASFIVIERPVDMEQSGLNGASFQSPDLPQTKLSDIFSSARDYSSQGSLYMGIEDGLQYLAQKYGEDKLFLGPPEAQIAGSYFGFPDLVPVIGSTSAAAALQAIITQGEGARGVTKDSHYGKFVGIQEEYEQLLKQDPNFEPGRAVLSNPYSMFPQDVPDTGDVNLIDDPFSIDISNLFDGCYELLIQMLGRLYLPSEERERELTQLSDMTVGMMMKVIGPLGQALTTLPAGPSHPGLMAGPSFRFSRDVNTPPHRAAAGALFIERLKELSAYCGFLQANGDISSVLTQVQRSLTAYADQLGDLTPAGDAKPVGSVTPVGDTKPVGSVTPVGDAKPVGNVTPVGDAKPIGDVTPVGDVKPAITVQRNGPYRVTGGVPLVRRSPVMSEHGEPIGWEDGDALTSRKHYLLCRCGQSSNKPFCDGTHTTVGFDGAEAADTGPIAERQKIYEGVKVVVKDDRSICTHAGFCSNRVTTVWKMTRKTDDAKVRAQTMAMIERCPSGALSYSLEAGGDDVEPDLPVEIAVTPDGPLWVTGRIPVERSDGQSLERRNRMTLCRCGASKTKPLCDGSHKEIGFSSD